MQGLLELHYNEALKHSASDFLVSRAASGESHTEYLKLFQKTFKLYTNVYVEV